MAIADTSKQRRARKFIFELEQWSEHAQTWAAQLRDTTFAVDITMVVGWYDKFEGDRAQAQSLIDANGAWFLTNYPIQHGWTTAFLTSIAEILTFVRTELDTLLGVVTVAELQALAPTVTVQQVLNNLPVPITWRRLDKSQSVSQAKRDALAAYIEARLA